MPQIIPLRPERKAKPVMHQLHERGLLDVERTFKQHLVARRERWRYITKLTQAEPASAAARAVDGTNHACRIFSGDGVVIERAGSPPIRCCREVRANCMPKP